MEKHVCSFFSFHLNIAMDIWARDLIEPLEISLIRKHLHFNSLKLPINFSCLTILQSNQRAIFIHIDY